jgi:acetylornithine deacetylase
VSEVVQLLQEMIAIPSISPGYRESFESPYGESEIGEFVAGWLRNHRIDGQRQDVAPGRFNVIGRIGPDIAARTIVLCSHLDTVDVSSMTIPPYDPQVRDGRVWGRGACDDKGPLAAMMIALKRLSHEGSPGAGVVLAAACGEEIGMLGSAAAVDAVQNVEAVVVGEPTLFDVVYAHKGVVRWRITTEGKSAHAASPKLGINAIYRMGRIIQAIEEYQSVLADERRHPALGPATINVGVAAGGSQINVVPESCHIDVDRRCIPAETPKQATEDLRSRLESDGRIDFDFKIEPLSEHAAVECDPENPFLKQVLECAQSLEPNASFQTAPYATDATNLQRWNAPTPVVGPGDMADAHTAAESISVEQLELGVELYCRIVKRFIDGA